MFSDCTEARQIDSDLAIFNPEKVPFFSVKCDLSIAPIESHTKTFNKAKEKLKRMSSVK